MKNVCNFTGRVGNDPECKTLQSGAPVVNFSMALTERWSDKATGEKKDRTEWVRIVVFNKHIAKFVENYVKKGSLIDVTSQVRTRSYDKDGVKQYVTEFVIPEFKGELILLDPKKSEETSEAPNGGIGEELSDDIPFAPMSKHEIFNY